MYSFNDYQEIRNARERCFELYCSSVVLPPVPGSVFPNQNDFFNAAALEGYKYGRD